MSSGKASTHTASSTHIPLPLPHLYVCLIITVTVSLPRAHPYAPYKYSDHPQSPLIADSIDAHCCPTTPIANPPPCRPVQFCALTATSHSQQKQLHSPNDPSEVQRRPNPSHISSILLRTSHYCLGSDVYGVKKPFPVRSPRVATNAGKRNG